MQNIFFYLTFNSFKMRLHSLTVWFLFNVFTWLTHLHKMAYILLTFYCSCSDVQSIFISPDSHVKILQWLKICDKKYGVGVKVHSISCTADAYKKCENSNERNYFSELRVTWRPWWRRTTRPAVTRNWRSAKPLTVDQYGTTSSWSRMSWKMPSLKKDSSNRAEQGKLSCYVQIPASAKSKLRYIKSVHTLCGL